VDARSVTVLGQDPSVAGGAEQLVGAFARAAQDLGWAPRRVYLGRDRGVSLAGRSFAARARFVGGSPPATALPSLLPELDALNQLWGGVRARRAARDAEQLWVVAAAASYGLAAPRSRRPYACWVATGLEDEWRSRRAGLPASRRLALRVNGPALRRLERTVLARAARVFGISPWSAESLAAAGALERERVGVLPIPVDLERFRPEPEQAWRAGLERPVLAFVGRADDPRKNVALLLDAFARLRVRVPAARLRLVGTPPARPLPDGAEALGPVPDVAAALRGATLFVLPSLQEGFGIVVAEALAAGLPAVVTPCGGPEDLVRRSGGGRVLESFDADELAAELEDLLADADALARLRAAGRRHVEHEHSPERLRALLAPVLEELAAGG
jgi:glycosyltransferase involved in cell wall biosynthesis